MNTFVWAIVIWFTLEIICKAVMIAKQQFTRTANSMIVDMVVILIVLIWGVWLLSATPSTP